MFWKKWFFNNEEEVLQNFEDYLDVKAIVLTDVGNVRTNNEDRALFIRPSTNLERNEKGFLAILADGMGGHSSGEVAAGIALDTIQRVYYKEKGNDKQLLNKAFSEANENIFRSAHKNSKNKGMGTTCSTILIKKNKIYLAHVGDSRIYFLNNGQLQQISEDHTYVMDLFRNGMIKEDEINNHPERNILTRAMGTKEKVEFQILEIDLIPQEIEKILICSDGLYEYIKTNEIQDILNRNTISEAAHHLVRVAKQRGGHDNITLVLMDFIQREIQNELKETKSFD
ncbi:MAG: Stp1/IreP family PP2C-type Ser/Thr phosphatase [Saprospiraceae bacterium]|nr:Stp1/IreP family PP2C-type Ser/Thr phosphatase [Saprospiraceae bacterium]